MFLKFYKYIIFILYNLKELISKSDLKNNAAYNYDIIILFKFKKLFFIILSCFLGIPFIIFIRLISPFKKILIGSILDPNRIGGQHYFLDWYIT